MKKSLDQLDDEVKDLKSQNEGDKFTKVVNKFIAFAKSQYEDMKAMYDMVGNSYTVMGKYFTLDIEKYRMEKFFKDINSFKEFFVVRFSLLLMLFKT